MTDTISTNPEGSLLDRPDESLAGSAAVAWQAYNAMVTTKNRHFEFLKIIDNKKKNYNIDPTEKDSRLLACLLKDHDEQVKRFKQASLLLNKEDSAAHTALFNYIGALSSETEQQPVKH